MVSLIAAAQTGLSSELLAIVAVGGVALILAITVILLPSAWWESSDRGWRQERSTGRDHMAAKRPFQEAEPEPKRNKAAVGG